MRFTGSQHSRSVTGLALTGALIGALLAPPSAQAVTPAGAPSATMAAASALSDQLGDRSAGAYLDRDSGAMVITVTDQAAADAVRATDAVPKLVRNGREALERATAELDATARIPGTTWATDPVTNQVLVTYDSTVTGATLDRLTATVARLGGLARLEATSGVLSPTIAGGDAIYGGGYRCSLGFNVRSGSTYYFLTAGHCGNLASTWYADSSGATALGARSGSSFPGNDYAIIRYTNTSITISGSVGTQDIASAATPAVGQTVYRKGSTTGTRSGQVTALNATVNYSEGSVSGLIRTNVCAQSGDSGGALYNGTVAYGLTSGGSGDCTTGGTTFFQPVVEPLAAYGVSIF